jgi:hypothetical protein
MAAGPVLSRAAALLPWPRRVRAFLKASPRVHDATGKSAMRQFVELLRVAALHGVPADDYYRFALFLRDNRESANQYLYQHDVMPLLAALGLPDVNEIADKGRFAFRCGAAALPVVEPLAIFRDGRLVFPLAWQPPASDLFIKPTVGNRGEGAVVVRYLSGGRYRLAGDGDLTSRDFVDKLAARSRARSLLVQRRLETRAELADLTTGALMTVRAVTVLDERDRPEHVLSVLKMPLGDRETDNLGLASPILTDGRLGRAISYRPVCEGFDTHPDTGAAIAGRLVPDWPQARDLALRAHSIFPEFFALGWDIAMPAGTPVLLEANVGWDTGTIQRPHATPLGRTRFATLAAARLAAQRA